MTDNGLNAMPKFSPLQSNPSKTPVLYLDSEASLADLQTFAAQRCKAARDLMWSVSGLDINDTNGKDLSHFAMAAWLLLQDGCYALEVVGWGAEIDGANGLSG